MTPEQYAEKAKADAIAKGSTPEVAEAAYATSLAEAKTIMGHPLYAGLQAVNAEIAGRVTPLKQQLEEAAPLIEAGRKALDANKTAETRLAELQAQNEKNAQALIETRRNAALQVAAIKAGVDPAAALKLADSSGVKDDGTGADEAVAAVVKAYPGLVTPAGPGRSPGPGGPGASTPGTTMKRGAFDALSPTEKDKFLNEGGVPVD